MATRYDLTVDFNDLLGAEPSRIAARLTTNLPRGAAVMDETNQTVNLNTGKVNVANDGTATLSLISTASTDLNIAADTLQYRLTAEATVGRDRVTFDSGWFAFTAAADITELDLQQPALIPSGPGGSSSLTVVNGGTVDLDNTKPDGYLIGYKVTAATTIEGVSFAVGSYIFERDSSVYGGWTYRTLDTATQVVPPLESVPPTAGTLAASAITETGFTLTVTGASDETALHATPYAFSTDNGTTWTAYQSENSRVMTDLTPATAYQARHRVRDASGNVTTGAAVTATTTVDIGAIPDIMGWWDSADAATLTLSGLTVTSWANKVAGKSALTPGGTAPTKSATGIEFTPTATLASGTDMVSASDDVSMFMVMAYRPSTISSLKNTLRWGSSASGPGWVRVTDVHLSYIVTGADSAIGVIGTSGAPVLTYLRMVMEETSEGSADVGLNDDTPATSTVAQGQYVPTSTKMEFNGSGANGSDWVLMEFIAYARSVTDPERNQIKGYLKAKWGTP